MTEPVEQTARSKTRIEGSADVDAVDSPGSETISEQARKASQLPQPMGHKLLIMLPEVSEMTEGGIVKPRSTQETEQVGSVVGFVAEMGPSAYLDERRFPTGPWCKKGDWIVMRSYAGTRLRIHGREMRLINDDSVEAVVDDPRGIERI